MDADVLTSHIHSLLKHLDSSFNRGKSGRVRDIVEYLWHAQERGEISFLLIGGRSLEAYGYVRNTRDIDLLIASKDIPAMEGLLISASYQKVAESPIFSRWQHRDLMEEDIDLMFVDEGTFDKLSTGCGVLSVGSASLRVPSVASLIALKLHAMKNNPERFGKDATDILEIIKRNPMSITENELNALCVKFGPPDCWAKINLLRQ